MSKNVNKIVFDDILAIARIINHNVILFLILNYIAPAHLLVDS